MQRIVLPVYDLELQKEDMNVQQRDSGLSWEDELVVDICCKYFKSVFGINRSNVNNQMLCTPFHIALVHNNKALVENVLQKLEDEVLVKLLVNAKVKYAHNCPEYTGLSPDMGFVIPIKHELTKEETNFVEGVTKSRCIVKSSLALHQGAVLPDYPLTISAVASTEDLLTLLLDVGADPFNKDINGDTIIHKLVRLSAAHPEKMVKALIMIINWLNDEKELQKLLLVKNLKGKTALDLASRKGLPEMLKVLINVEGVYKFLVSDCGLVRHHLYDVTQYERYNTDIANSVLYRLTEMDEETLARAQKCSLLSSEPFATWINLKFSSSRGIILMFVVFWIFFTSIYIIQVSLYFRDGYSRWYLHVFLFLCSLCVLIPEIFHSRANFREIYRSTKNIIRHAKFPVTFTFSYRVFQLVFSICVIINALATMFTVECSALYFFHNIYVVSTVCVSMSLMFFLQLISGIGPLLIAVQKMVYQAVIFMSMIIFMYLGFAASFYFVHVRPSCRESLRNNNSSCNKGMFLTVGHSFYETLLISLNIMTPKDIYFSQSYSKGITVTLYIISVMVISIVLLNMLIAIMGRRLEDIASLRDDILKLERLSITLYLEERLQTKIVQKLGNFMKRFKVKPFVKYKRFTTDSVTGKIYLEVVENYFSNKANKSNV